MHEQTWLTSRQFFHGRKNSCFLCYRFKAEPLVFGSLSPLTVLTNFTLCIKTVKHTLGKLSVALVMKCVRVTAW